MPAVADTSGLIMNRGLTGSPGSPGSSGSPGSPTDSPGSPGSPVNSAGTGLILELYHGTIIPEILLSLSIYLDVLTGLM